MAVQAARCRGCMMSTTTMADMVNIPAAPMPCMARPPIKVSGPGLLPAITVPIRKRATPKR